MYKLKKNYELEFKDLIIRNDILIKEIESIRKDILDKSKKIGLRTNLDEIISIT